MTGPASASSSGLPPLSTRIGRVLALDPAAPAVEFDGTWHPWGELAGSAAGVAAAVAPGTRVGLVLRNRPPQLGLLVGLLAAGACVVAVDPGRGDERVRSEVGGLDVAVLAGAPADLDALPAPAGARRLASPALGMVEAERPTAGSEPAAGAGAAAGRPGGGVAVEMLTSGTTGPPTRVALGYQALATVLAGAKHYESDRADAVRLRAGVAVVNAPLVHVSGLFRVLQCVADGRSFCLLERFSVGAWVDAVRRHRPRTASLVPTALRMVLDARLDPADLASLRSVVCGTAPLAAEDADAFLAAYGVPVLVSYGATEFGGGVAGWTRADHETWWERKKGSVGRAHPGCELRVVEPQTGEPLPVGAEGLLEVRAAQVEGGRRWVRTTDQARIDDDGFVWILGRADQAIVRGGFKVRPETVRAALEADPRVAGAAVVGRPDARLGAVPVAVVELRPDAPPTAASELLGALAMRLSRYEVPVQLVVVDRLPRTPSGKADLPAARSIVAAATVSEEADLQNGSG